MTNPTRREAIVTIAAASTALAQPRALAPATTLTAGELKEVANLADLIIPRTDTPGASDAGVHIFIDRRLAGSARLADQVRAGLKALGPDFFGLTSEQQIERLTAMSQDPFFRLFKGLVVDGYYSSKEGLTQELGWHGNTFLTEFKGCTHPEHQS